MRIELNKELFYVNDNEFPIYNDLSYTTLKLYPQLGIFEREIGLIAEIGSIAEINNSFSEARFINIGVSHGGYVPIKLIPYVNNIYVIEKNKEHLDNLHINCIVYDLYHKISVVDEFQATNLGNKMQIIRFDSLDIDERIIDILKNSNNTIILSYKVLNLFNYKQYNLNDLVVYVTNDLVDIFEQKFKYYLNSNNLNYNNLINVCMIVKNAGDGFRDILQKNLPYIDQWTILDTGSTDNTVEIIKDVLKTKKGNLYQEPFINFRDSRNRCLELAGQSCKFTIMLDDTYVLKGNVREFLNYIRSDQYADSYNIFVNSDDNIYGSNRVLKSDRNLKYIYLIHEIIQNYNNIVVQTPLDQISIDDITNDYMVKRSQDRKQYDLELLLKTLEEYPDVPRTYYYITRTYSDLELWDKTFENAMKRIDHPKKGYNEEITECYLICGNIAELKFKWEWEKCEEIYLKCYNHDTTRADALYCIGMHYLNQNPQKSYEYLKKGFELNISSTATSNLRINIYNKLLPFALTGLCYQLKDYKLGEQSAEKYIKNNDANQIINSYYKIFKLLNQNSKNSIKKSNRKDILCFVAYNSFKDWNGDSINTEGVGGSETYIIEMARNIVKMTNFDVYVFCNTDVGGTFDNVKYKKINKYVKFLNSRKIHTSIISRYSEYIPVTVSNDVDNIYLVVHDLTPSCNIIPFNDKFKGIFCMSEWHKQYFSNIYPTMTDIIFVFPNGININQYPPIINKKKNSFIYSSLPNRGLIDLLKIFPKIKEKLSDATLNVFCDTKHKWIRSIANEEMDIIEKLLEEQKEYIINHGWVTKDILTKYYLESEVWIYPCTFQETFCITALEAAASNTLAITTDLAALNETVGDRGIIIPGNPNTQEWQNTAVNELINIMNDVERKNDLLAKNRKWAEAYDWSLLVTSFINKFIGLGKPVNNNFTKHNTPIEENIKYLCNRFSHCNKVLEVGPDKRPFPLATHFIDHIKNDSLDNLIVLDITKEKLPFNDNEFDLVYCGHVLEGIHNPEFVINELVRVARIIYIETPSPLAETCRYIDGNSSFRGYIHHRYLIWINNNQIKILPKYPFIEHIDLPNYHKKLEDPYFWNTYFIWNKDNGNLSVEYLKYDTDYETIVKIAIEECIESIKLYKNQINLTQNNIEYAGMLNWSSDIPNNTKHIFENVLDRFKNQNINILEIGTSYGTSIISMLKYLPDARGTVIDMWEDYEEDGLLHLIKQNKIEEMFLNNITIANMLDRITIKKGDSKDVLMKLLLGGNKYDFIYVDGSHKCLDCYSDMIISWELLNPGGVLGIDDYQWQIKDSDKLNLPYYAVQHFMERYKGKYTTLNIGYRVFLLKQ